MSLVKRYTPTGEPVVCCHADPRPFVRKCYAELIIQKPEGPVYVCRMHAARELSGNAGFLADIVKQLFLKE